MGVGEYQTLSECRDAIEKLTGAALDGKIVKLTALVSVNLSVKLLCGHAEPLASSVWFAAARLAYGVAAVAAVVLPAPAGRQRVLVADMRSAGWQDREAHSAGKRELGREVEREVWMWWQMASSVWIG
jgi:hypothetical protein